MTRYKFTLGAVSLALALGAVPALAGQAGGRPSGGAPSAGTATPSGGGGSATSSSSSSSSSSGGASSSSGSSSSSPSSAPEPRSSFGRDSGIERAPQHPSSAGSRPSGGYGGGERAVPRGGAGGEGSGGRVASSTSVPGDDRMSAPERRAVPSYSRPSEGRPIIGQAVNRVAPVIDSRRYGYFYDPYYGGYYYDPYGYYGYYNYGYYGYRPSLWWSGYGMGLGYFYDPFYDPFWYGSAGAYPGYYGSSGGYSRAAYREAGSLRLKVRPHDAQVLIDGYYVGTVDDFDGLFQRLHVDAGSHRVELRAPGFAPVQFEVLVTPGETVTYKGDMRRIQ